MNFVLERVSGPSIECITLAEAIQHVREFATISQAAQDELTGLVVAAREWVEDFTGRVLVDSKWRLTLFDGTYPFDYTDTNTVTPIYRGTLAPNFSGIQLRKSPVLALVSIASVDSLGVETALNIADYEVREPDSKWPRLVALSGGSWTGTMRIVFRAGFADRLGSPTEDASVVPVRFKQAMKLWVEAHYNRDEKMMKILLDAAEGVIRPEKADLSFA